MYEFLIFKLKCHSVFTNIIGNALDTPVNSDNNNIPPNKENREVIPKSDEGTNSQRVDAGDLNPDRKLIYIVNWTKILVLFWWVPERYKNKS